MFPVLNRTESWITESIESKILKNFLRYNRQICHKFSIPDKTPWSESSILFYFFPQSGPESERGTVPTELSAKSEVNLISNYI